MILKRHWLEILLLLAIAGAWTLTEWPRKVHDVAKQWDAVADEWAPRADPAVDRLLFNGKPLK